ncbi:MAG: multiheme c-type cytochrome [Phycisphaerales bacterium]
MLCDSRKRLLVRSFLAVAAMVILLASCASFKHLTFVSNTFPRAKDCGKCHVDIYHEWSESDHAYAYTNPHFRSATNNYSFEDCLDCHAPEPMLTADTPATRAVGREEGVTCVACHLDRGELCGPLEPTGKVHPHPVGVRREVYYNTGICGRCHEGTFEEWSSIRGDKETCQQCHMEPVMRKVTQATGGISNVLVSMEKQVPQKRHGFRILQGAQSDQLIPLKIESSDGSLCVHVQNRLPHSLPTGDFGFRVLHLDVFGIDADGNATLAGRWELAGESATAIAPQESREWPLEWGGDCRSVRAVLTRRSYDGEALVLAETQVEVAKP